MGNTNTPEFQTKNHKKDLQFLSTVQKVASDYSQKWGNYSIYQQQSKPYDYFLEYINVSLTERDFLQKKLSFYQNMPKHKNLVPVQFAEIVKRKQMCAQFDVLRLFFMYYNFTLEDAIKVKIKQRSCFTEGELVYILRSLLLIGNYFESELKSKCYSGIFNSKDIYISPEGHLKIYPFNQNIFSSFIEIYNRKGKNQEDEIQDKKIYVRKQTKANNQSYELDRNGLKRGEQRKGGLRTTLKDESLRQVNSVKLFQTVRSKQAVQSQPYFSQQKSQSNSMNRQSSQSFSINQRMSEEHLQGFTKPTHVRDWFDLGLLMMQLILLNESHEYYLEKQKTEESQYNEGQNLSFSKTKTVQKKQKSTPNQQNLNLSFKLKRSKNSSYFTLNQNQTYRNQNGKVPNFDLILFSLNNLLPKKCISPILIEIISLLITNKNPNLTYKQLISTIQQHQQTLTQPKYCLKFDIPKNDQQFTPEVSDGHISRYMVKNKSVDPLLKTTNLSSQAFIQDSSFNSLINQNKLLSQSKQSFFARNLDDFLHPNNLSKSMIIEEDMNKSSMVLDNLKKSRKLIPTKIRSVSNKNPDLPQIKNKKDTQNIQLTFG